MAIFQLNNGVRIAGNDPIDYDRYIADDLTARDQLITDGRAYVGLQVFVSGVTNKLYILKDFTPTWEEVGGAADITSLSSAVSAEVSDRISGDDSLSTIILTEISDRTSGDESLSTAITNVEDFTSNLSVGDLLYYEGTTISGVTNQMPSLSTAISSLNSGVSAMTLSGLTDVSISSITDNDILVWISTDARWENKNSLTGFTSLSAAIISGNESLSASVSGNISTTFTSLSTAISNSILSGDTSLSIAISGNISSGNISLSNAISINISSSDASLSGVLSTSISTEKSERISGDTSLSTKLSIEISDRISGDTSLSTILAYTDDWTSHLSTNELLYYDGTTVSGSTKLLWNGTDLNITGNTVSSNTRKITKTTLSASSIVWDMNVSCVAQVTLSGSGTLVINNMVSGDNGTLIVIQGGTGSYTLGLPLGSLAAGGAFTLSTGVGSKDILSFFYDGTNYFWNIGKNYS